MEKKARRSSRRIQGFEPYIDVPSSRSVYLPPELKVIVLAQLKKWDLKSVRLVSKEWNELATRPLFDKVYVSCRAKDIEVFKKITGHPVISTGVTKLVYDSSLFSNGLKYRYYFEEIRLIARVIARKQEPGTPFHSADVQINKFVQNIAEDTISLTELYKIHKMDTFIVEGYRKHRDNSAFERCCVRQGLFFNDLCTGLCSLNNLRSVVLSPEMWDYSNYLHFGTRNANSLRGPALGSPLCRGWNPFHLRPFTMKTLPDVDDGSSQVAARFHMLTQAISATKKSITSLLIGLDEIHGGLLQQALVKSNLTESQFWHFMTAYTNLKSLDIVITTDNPDQRDAPTVLPELLKQMYGLERLSLYLIKDINPPLLHAGLSEHYRYDEIFPAMGVWPKLTELSISGLAIGGWDLLLLISSRARLTRLEISHIDLLSGTWEGVIQGMRYQSRLTEMNMSGALKTCEGAVFKRQHPLSDYTDWEIIQDIQYYVAKGGRHPCLPEESGPETALSWCLDMMPEEELEDLLFNARQNCPELVRFISGLC